MATFSRSHTFNSGAGAFLPVGGHNIQGRQTVHIWSATGIAFTLRITRPDGVPIDLPVPAAPGNHWRTPLSPEELVNISANTADGSAINVAVI